MSIDDIEDLMLSSTYENFLDKLSILEKQNSKNPNELDNQM
jgi:hypothetical protein